MIEQSTKADATSRRFLLLRIFGSIFSLSLLVYLLLDQWDKFRDALSRLPWYTFCLCVVLILASRVCVTLRWLVLLRFAKARMSFWQAFRLMFMGNFASNFLPSTVGGDLVRLAGSVTLGVDTAVGAASLVLDRLIGMVGMASFGPYGLFLLAKQPLPGAMLQSLPAVGFFAGLDQKLRGLPMLGWMYQKTEQFARKLILLSAGWFRQPLSLVLALLFTYGHMLFTFLIIWVLLRDMHEPLSFLWIGALWSLSYFVSLAPISINGFGLQEVSITMLYSRFGGVSMEAALALALIVRMLFLLASLPGALFLPEILRPIRKSVLVETNSQNGSSNLL